MDEQTWVERRVEHEVERKGLRPRIAASVIALAWVAAIIIFGIVEHLVDPDNFDTIWLGMWWATQTVTTVGYGDAVPDQVAGQLIAVLLMIGGLSLFSVITGVITSAFVSRAQANRAAREAATGTDRAGAGAGDRLEPKLDRVFAELEQLRREVRSLRSPGDSPPPGDRDR